MVGSGHRTSLHSGGQALEVRFIVGNSDTSMGVGIISFCPSDFHTVTVVRSIASLGSRQQ